MAIYTTEEKTAIEKEFDAVIETCKRCQTDENKALIKKAFNLAVDAHGEMRRKSGEPYIMHPISVAKIVGGEIGLGAKSIICALLHDVVEDTDYTTEDIRGLFGEKIASIIDGLTKISGVFDQNASVQAENFKKMLLTLSEDVRVILIKLADRLHNMRTLSSMPYRKQVKIAQETLFLYAPMAHRLGLYTIKTELEDLALKYKQPAIYEDIRNKLIETENERNKYIDYFSQPLRKKLDYYGFKYQIAGRAKSIFSIWNKMQKKNVSFEEVYDIFAVRIVFEPSPMVPEKTQCWNIYSIVTDIYQPNPDRLRDWVSTPKANGYEALHTTVMGQEGKWVEVQIRTRRMDEIAERGLAAHWKYKSSESNETQVESWLSRIREFLENKEDNALEFLDDFKMNLFSSEIYVFTPKGLLVRLPKNATALDFAYEIHTEIGNKAIGAKVNYNLCPLSHELHSGDQVEIITSDKQKPQRDWIHFAITAKARSKIKDAFKEDRKSNIRKGQQMLEDKLKELNINLNSTIFRKIMNGYQVTTKDDLYYQIGTGIIELDNVHEIINRKRKNKWIKYWNLQLNKTVRNLQKPETKDGEQINIKKPVILKENLDHENYVLASCCNPIPGDEVIGYLENENIHIHKVNCPKAGDLMSTYGDNIMTAEWKSHKVLSFLATIKLKGIDRMGLVNELTNVISKQLYVNMRSVRFDSTSGVFEGTIDLYIHNTGDLNNLIKELKKIKGVRSVIRVENMEDN